VSHLTKTEMSRHTAEYCHNSWSKCPPFAHTHAWRRPCHSSIALSMMVWSVPNMQKMLLQFTTLVWIKLSAIYKKYLSGTGNLNNE